jgi:hypothetical protein
MKPLGYGKLFLLSWLLVRSTVVLTLYGGLWEYSRLQYPSSPNIFVYTGMSGSFSCCAVSTRALIADFDLDVAKK